jgi:hypothetical protein
MARRRARSDAAPRRRRGRCGDHVTDRGATRCHWGHARLRVDRREPARVAHNAPPAGRAARRRRAEADTCDRLAAREHWADMLSACCGLPPRQRRLLGLSAAGLGRAEFADATGDSPKTVDRHLGRAPSACAPAPPRRQQCRSRWWRNVRCKDYGCAPDASLAAFHRPAQHACPGAEADRAAATGAAGGGAGKWDLAKAVARSGSRHVNRNRKVHRVQEAKSAPV